MDQQTFININTILVQDSKSTTYKFALLRGTIDLINDNSPYIVIKDQRAHFPLGLMIEKWLLYYYPLANIPQIHGTANLAFSHLMKELTDYYQSRGGLSAFYNDLKNKGIPAYITLFFTSLVRKLADTIKNMPMQYIGCSITGKYYSIFRPEEQKQRKPRAARCTLLVQQYGTFSIPLEYYQAFQVLGTFLNGQDAILFKWAEFSVQASCKSLSIEQVLSNVLAKLHIIDSKFRWIKCPFFRLIFNLHTLVTGMFEYLF